MKKDGMIGKNRIEDVRWLCSLSESELDVLISLRKMVARRQYFILKKKGTRRSSIKHKSLSKRFDLKMLRDLSFVIMQVVKQRLVGTPQMAEARLDNSNREIGVEESTLFLQMAEAHADGSNREMGVEELTLLPQMAEACVDNSNREMGLEESTPFSQIAEARADSSNREMGVEESTPFPQMAEARVDNTNLEMGGEELITFLQRAKARVDNSNLANYKISEEFREMGARELTAYICPDRKKRISKLFGIQDFVPKKK